MAEDTRHLLEEVRDGIISVDEALLAIKKQPFEDIDFAKVDVHRKSRQGIAEVIYGAGKTAEQIIAIAATLSDNGQLPVIITRLDKEKAVAVSENLPIKYNERARFATLGELPEPDGRRTPAGRSPEEDGISYSLLFVSQR